jgi:hypothetical protein
LADLPWGFVSTVVTFRSKRVSRWFREKSCFLAELKAACRIAELDAEQDDAA